jgi:hypothetical protein
MIYLRFFLFVATWLAVVGLVVWLLVRLFLGIIRLRRARKDVSEALSEAIANAIVIFLLGWRRMDPEDRRRKLWLIAGCTLVVVLLIIGSIPPR